MGKIRKYIPVCSLGLLLNMSIVAAKYGRFVVIFVDEEQLC